MLDARDDGRTLVVSIDGAAVLEYVYLPAMAPTHSPRPYFHPIRTLGGTVLTEIAPADHPWHYGVSIAVPLIDAVSFWGGPTFVAGDGYVDLDNHGRVEHRAWVDGLVLDDRTHHEQELTWLRPGGSELLRERRTIAVRRTPSAPGVWTLTIRSELRNVTGTEIEIGSPATSGRPGAGYGGFFWRGASRFRGAHAFDALGNEGEGAFGSTADWLAVTDGAASLVFAGNGADGFAREPWFLRLEEYPGVCAPLAFHRPAFIAAGASLLRRHVVHVLDGSVSAESAARLVTAD